MAASPRTRETRANQSRASQSLNRPQRRKENRFLVEESGILPVIPPSDEWAYLWLRVSVAGRPDGNNIMRHTTGLLRYEFVDPAELPELANLVEASPQHAKGTSNVIQVNDVVLVRVPKDTREEFIEATHIWAEQQSDAERAAIDSYRDPKGRTALVREEDQEAGGWVEGSAA